MTCRSSKDELIEHIWRGRFISDAALNSRINSARKAIGETGKQQALTRAIQRRGFSFTAKLTSQPDDQLSSAAEPMARSMPRALAAQRPLPAISGEIRQERTRPGSRNP